MENTSKIKKGISESELTAIIESIKDEDTKALAQLLLEMKHDSERREQHIKRQSIAAMVSAGLCLILVIAILITGMKFMPTVTKLATDATVLVNNTNDLIAQTSATVENANAVIASTTDIIAQTDVIISNLDAITTDLANVKIQETMDNVNNLVIQSGENMSSALSKVEEIDIESLNQAITDLQNVIQPLSKLFKR